MTRKEKKEKNRVRRQQVDKGFREAFVDGIKKGVLTKECIRQAEKAVGRQPPQEQKFYQDVLEDIKKEMFPRLTEDQIKEWRNTLMISLETPVPYFVEREQLMEWINSTKFLLENIQEENISEAFTEEPVEGYNLNFEGVFV